MSIPADRHSVAASSLALRDAIVAGGVALAMLVLALLTAPIRLVRGRSQAHARPASITHVEVQVHLEDARCAVEMHRVLRHTLERAARTWAPLPLPIDRIVVGVGFPARGRVDAYQDFPRLAGDAEADSRAIGRPLVVVTLGVRDGERELEPAEICGALAAQIQAVIADRHPCRSIVAVAQSAHTPSAPSPVLPTAALPVKPLDRPTERRNGGLKIVRPLQAAATDQDEGTVVAFESDPLVRPSNGHASD
jgi:hypothetical protein